MGKAWHLTRYSRSRNCMPARSARPFADATRPRRAGRGVGRSVEPA
jgi:hypothetical protein